ncbi:MULTISPECIES: sodium:calcium antiporter [Archaeoglobus]|jgi:cation:H+ antiporter|uniref:Sodium/calcium exchanger membrane region domain-containing protein n=1 Tax=Archaeoglobus fulgidus (strain ATCC 49558 / DSM 4304 / JCM 9628 / NBRC 100126 / VC-16) TaxID=224325 RepID=O29988_ARCFU|nr:MULTISPECIES: sodium:calcium antiporter [Archaeoglobus]AAB90982.1 predicted coding region AF_0251 [Archaeoglobus fulgidus DSM 4304]MDI3498351.1 cation:H+ antiporter [Archaeoglobus sp.]
MDFTKEKFQLLAISSLTLPWLISLAFNYHHPALTQTLLSGLAVVSASFLISWAAETAEMDVPRSFSLAIVALLAVLPEYAVDGYFAWKAGSVGGEYVHYATANMTGANRLLIGIGWSLVAFIAFRTLKSKEVELDDGIRLEIFFLFLATLYAFTLPLKGHISPFDALVFVSLYAIYIYLSTKAEREEVEVGGVPAYLCSLKTETRRLSVVVLFLFAGFTILMSVEAFSEGLLETARIAGIDEFLAVQWIAPLASESPELIVAIYFVRRFRVSASMNALISSKVNQWTLLIGTIAIIYSISAFKLQSLPLDARQSEEVLLTAAQSLFAVAILLDLKISWKEASALFLLFIVQLLFPGVEVRYIISAIYIILSLPILFAKRKEIVESFRTVKRLIS